MASYSSKILFDKKDHDLIKIVNEVLRDNTAHHLGRKLYYPIFHPLGIKEMVESRGLRIAYAVAYLLNSLEIGGIDDRITALKLVHSEVIETAEGPMPKNTARVLLQLMKELIRSHGNYLKQLQLAHDFRTTASGKPKTVRRQLQRYHLLEMPETWNQITFDDHVHDVNTKGRKSPTHLIMDAWIKGIRKIRVIHYNFIEPRFAAELLAAADILKVETRIGIEFPARFRNKYVHLIWVPRGFSDAKHFLKFLSDPQVMALMEKGRESSIYQQRYLSQLIENFNSHHLPHINRTLDIAMKPIEESEFLKFVGIGQKSKLHLAEIVHQRIYRELEKKIETFKTIYQKSDRTQKKKIREQVNAINQLDIEQIVKELLSPEKNPDILPTNRPTDDPKTPPLLQLSPYELLNSLTRLRSGYRVTLNLANQSSGDVLELLYDCKGLITRLEILNLKDFAEGKTSHIYEINRLQQAINEHSDIQLKQIARNIIQTVAEGDDPLKEDRIVKLNHILHHLHRLQGFYKIKSLKARIGSDSTGRSQKKYGMGLAIMETLPIRAQRSILRKGSSTLSAILPVHISAYRTRTYIPYNSQGLLYRLLDSIAGIFPFLSWMGFKSHESWTFQDNSTKITQKGNVVALGGIPSRIDNGFAFYDRKNKSRSSHRSLRYINSRLRNGLKVLLGFIPAFATFMLTKEWWVLAYFGAFIWFGITGLRNILQSVLGGGGLKRSPLIRWNDYLSWDRITDSLLFTGFSVPLLDYVVKTLILEYGFNITTSSHPILLYTFMALANGIYLSSHNVFRGLPKSAAYWNFFRSVLSIPIAVSLNTGIRLILISLNIPAPDSELQKWATIISKTASDCIAGIIEGLADRYANIRKRLRDYKSKFADIMDLYTQLELLYPELQTYSVLDVSPHPKAKEEGLELEKKLMLHAIDMLYFWMYQPRGRSAFNLFIESLSEDERYILISSQETLQRHREISQLFIDGIFGNNFPKALSFYLTRYPEYLQFIKRMIVEECKISKHYFPN